jgi:cell division protein FtsN
MSVYRVSALAAAAIIAAAVVTAYATEVRQRPIEVKGQQPAAPALESACPQEPWPYGCQWRERRRPRQAFSRS